MGMWIYAASSLPASMSVTVGTGGGGGSSGGGWVGGTGGTGGTTTFGNTGLYGAGGTGSSGTDYSPATRVSEGGTGGAGNGFGMNGANGGDGNMATSAGNTTVDEHAARAQGGMSAWGGRSYGEGADGVVTCDQNTSGNSGSNGCIMVFGF